MSNERSDFKFRENDIVKTTYGPGIIVYGHVTIPGTLRSKVIWDVDWAYDYYDNDTLTKVSKKEYLDAQSLET